MKYSIYLIVAAVLVASIIGYGEYRYAAGREKERMKHWSAVAAHAKAMKELKDEHTLELEKLTADYAARASIQSRKILELIRQNKEIRDWWNTVIPPDVAAFAWMRPGADSSMQRGSNTVATDSSSSNAGEAH